MWANIWLVAATRVALWTWIWHTRHCGLTQKMAKWFQHWKKLSLFHLTVQIILALLIWKLMSLVYMRNQFLRRLVCFSLLKRIGGSYIVFVAKTTPNEIETFVRSMKFVSSGVILYVYGSTMGPNMKYISMSGLVLQATTWVLFFVFVLFCFISKWDLNWQPSNSQCTTLHKCMLDKVQKGICGAVGPTLPTSLEF